MGVAKPFKIGKPLTMSQIIKKYKISKRIMREVASYVKQVKAERRGNCYVTCEALYHLLGGKAAGWKPMVMRVHGDTHWFLKHSTGMILDPTVSQFKYLPVYSLARGSGFLTKGPSRRAKALMDRMVWQ